MSKEPCTTCGFICPGDTPERKHSCTDLLSMQVYHLKEAEDTLQQRVKELEKGDVAELVKRGDKHRDTAMRLRKQLEQAEAELKKVMPVVEAVERYINKLPIEIYNSTALMHMGVDEIYESFKALKQSEVKG